MEDFALFFFFNLLGVFFFFFPLSFHFHNVCVVAETYCSISCYLVSTEEIIIDEKYSLFIC